jgi:hypothetical protein
MHDSLMENASSNWGVLRYNQSMHYSKISSIALIALSLGACTPSSRPEISFIGIATGTLVTDLNQLQFSNQFDRNDRNLVAVVGFNALEEGTTVQATWFSPDERQMPLGRNSIVTQSGAQIVRFSFASKDPWNPAPYMLRIDAWKDPDTMLASSGSLSFYIGMTDKQIADYRKEFSEWLSVEAAKRADWEQEQAEFQQLLARVRNELGFSDSAVGLRSDLTGDKQEDYVIVDTEESLGPNTSAGVLFSKDVTQAAVVDHSGSVLFSLVQIGSKRVASNDQAVLTENIPRGATLHLSVLPSSAISLYWPMSEQVCYAEFELENGRYALSREGCR